MTQIVQNGDVWSKPFYPIDQGAGSYQMANNERMNRLRLNISPITINYKLRFSICHEYNQNRSRCMDLKCNKTHRRCQTQLTNKDWCQSFENGYCGNGIYCPLQHIEKLGVGLQGKVKELIIDKDRLTTMIHSLKVKLKRVKLYIFII